MTDNYPPPLPIDVYVLPQVNTTTAPPTLSPSPTGGEQPSITDVAKDQAAAVGQGAAEAGQHVATVAKDQAV